MPTITEDRLEANGLSFAVLRAGSPHDPLALCLHGFPDTPQGWRPVLERLAAAGFQAVAPWARGYAPTQVPADGSSPISAWAADANALHEVLGGGREGVLVGHDWGALATYAALGSSSGRWRCAVTASVPPTAYMAARLTDYDQLKAFWYQRFFADPIAEDVVAADDFAFVERLWRDWSPSLDPSAALEAVRAAFVERANLTAALSTYRTLQDLSLQPPEFVNELMGLMAPLAVPVRYLHGVEDGCVPNLDVAELSGLLPEGSDVHLLEGAGHFVQYEQPERVADLVVEFVSR